jgi:hypothetical protein
VSDEFHKPTLFSGSKFDSLEGGDDPARVIRVAHETARALLSRARNAGDPGVVDRLVHYTDEHGLDALAELWARSGPRTLPGALWRLYLVRLLIHQDPAGVSLLFQRGTEVLSTIDALVAGAPVPAGPDEVTDLADRILRGVFEGDFALALDRRRRSGCRQPGTRVRAHHARPAADDDGRGARGVRPHGARRRARIARARLSRPGRSKPRAPIFAASSGLAPRGVSAAWHPSSQEG